LERLLGQLGDPDPDQMESRMAAIARSIQSIALESHGQVDVEGVRAHTLVPPNRSRRPRKMAFAFALFAAALVATLSAAVWQINVDDSVAKSAGRSYRAGETFRAGAAGTSMVTLADDSRVEMRAGAEAQVERASDGLRIRLSAGSIIVNAAK